jgi:hypothetical protein
MNPGDRDQAPDVSLVTPLSLASSFRFPLQSRAARRDLLWGAALLVLLPGLGWLLNMGHRIKVVHRMQHGEPPWPAWNDYAGLFKHGLITLGGMIAYYAPGAVLAIAAWKTESVALGAVASILLAGATVAIPGFMSHYCRRFDPAEIYNPMRALRRCLQGGASYWHAWAIALTALALSFAGLLGLGIGFLVTSVWFWQVAGFAFASVFTRRFELDRFAAPPASQPSPRYTASTL